ncbi:MAG: substrate-binding domain-containing protein [Cyanobacteria bacterium]|nr:substrate-binding domain-containing protein [Cyanobacteriota bacterium]
MLLASALLAPALAAPKSSGSVAPGLNAAVAPAGRAVAAKETGPLRFVVIPKLPHPWFDTVHQGALEAAATLERQTGRTVQIEYRPPARAEVAEQAAILEAAIASRPSGITIDLVDGPRLKPLLERAVREKIPVTVFDSVAPEGLALPSIGNDFCLQARISSERLVQLLDGQGEVAILQGVPTAPNHAIRVRCHREVFAGHPGIRVVASPADNDSIAEAEQQVRLTQAAHPALRGWVTADAGGGIGIARALKSLGLTGKVKVVALDDLPETLYWIRQGVVDSTAATRPRAQGYWAVVALWQLGLGAPTMERFNTGILVEKGLKN